VIALIVGLDHFDRKIRRSGEELHGVTAETFATSNVQETSAASPPWRWNPRRSRRPPVPFPTYQRVSSTIGPNRLEWVNDQTASQTRFSASPARAKPHAATDTQKT
jgi:hypothetical protein